MLVAQSCPTLCHPTNCSPPGFSVYAKSLQSCPTLCDPIDGSPPGSPVPGILQARTLEWVAISFSNAWKWRVKVKSLSCVRLLATPWTAAYQAPPSMGFSRQEYWSGVPLPSPSLSIGFSKQEYWSELPFPFSEDLSDPGIEPRSPALQAASLSFELQENPMWLWVSITTFLSWIPLPKGAWFLPIQLTRRHK